MEHPLIRANLLKRLTEIAKPISVIRYRHGYTTIRAYYAELIFGKITLNAISICNLLSTAEKEVLDVSSIASLARNLMEAYNNLNYICIEKISDEEREFRVNLMSLHHAIELRKIMSLLSFEEDNMTRTIFEMTESMSNLKLEQNKYFQLLDEETKKKLLKGSRAYFKKGGMVQKFPLNLSMEAGIYKFLSNSVHSSPLSLMNYYGGSQSNPLDSLGVLFIAVETSNLYLATSINAYTRIRWKAAKLVNDEDKIFVKSIMNSSSIQKWIEYRKWLDDQHNFYKAIKS